MQVRLSGDQVNPDPPACTGPVPPARLRLAEEQVGSRNMCRNRATRENVLGKCKGGRRGWVLQRTDSRHLYHAVTLHYQTISGMIASRPLPSLDSLRHNCSFA